MEVSILEKTFLEQQIEMAQKNIWNLKIEIRLLERGKLSAGNTKLLDIETAIKDQKNQIDYWEKRQELLKDKYKEVVGEDIKLLFK